jgi:hypothetical protein
VIDHHIIPATSAEAVMRYLSSWYFGEAWRVWTEDPAHLAPGLNNGGGVYFGGITGIRTMMHHRRRTMCNFAFLMNWVRTRPGVKERTSTNGWSRCARRSGGDRVAKASAEE